MNKGTAVQIVWLSSNVIYPTVNSDRAIFLVKCLGVKEEPPITKSSYFLVRKAKKACKIICSAIDAFQGKNRRTIVYQLFAETTALILKLSSNLSSNLLTGMYFIRSSTKLRF